MPPSGPDISTASADSIGAPRTVPASAGPGETPVRLDKAGFADRFSAASKGLWCIAAAIVRDRDEAHDVVQEAAMVALAKLNEFDARTSFSAWAGQIVRFVALNEARRRKRDPLRPTDPESFAGLGHAAPTPGPASGLFDRAVQSALDTLDEIPRTCLLMRTVLDLTYTQISESLCIPEGTAMSHVHRARAVMRAALATTHPQHDQPRSKAGDP